MLDASYFIRKARQEPLRDTPIRLFVATRRTALFEKGQFVYVAYETQRFVVVVYRKHGQGRWRCSQLAMADVPGEIETRKVYPRLVEAVQRVAAKGISE